MAKNKVSKKPISEEEYTTNKVLGVFTVCLCGVLVLMILQRLLDYGHTWRIGMLTTKVLLGIGVVGVLWSFYLFSRERAAKKDAARRLICGRNILIMGLVMILSMFSILYIGSAPIKVLYVVLPVLAVYYLIFHSYTPDFFLISLDCGIGIGLIWLVHRALNSLSHTNVAYIALGIMVVVTIAQLIWLSAVRKNKGKCTLCRKMKNFHFSENAYKMLIVTPLLMTILIAFTLFVPMHLFIALGIGAAYLFITAVYYTVKLM